MTDKPTYEELENRVRELKRAELDRKNAEEALRESEEKYRRIFENSVVGFFRSTPEGRFLEVNAAFARMLGYESPEDLVSTITDIATQYYVNPQDREKYKAALLEQGHVENFEFRAKCKDGVEIWVSNSTRAFFNGDGEVAFQEGIVVDITERKLAEEMLGESERRMSQIIEFLPDATFAIDIQGKVTAWNKAMEALTGIRASEILGKGGYLYAVPFYGEPRPVLIDMVLTQDQKMTSLYPSFRREGDRLFSELYLADFMGHGPTWHWVTASPLYNPDGRIVGAIESSRDITRHKQTEEALRERNKELTCLQRIRDFLDENLPIGEICRRAIESLAQGMHFPESALPVITLDGERYGLVEEEAEPDNGIHADINVGGEKVGRMSVFYRKDESFLLPEEQNLLENASKILSHYLERIYAQEELHERENRLQLALRGADLGTWDWNVQTGRVSFDRRWAEMLGYRLEDIEPTLSSWERLVHPEDLPSVKRSLAAHLSGRTEFYETEHRERHKSGKWIWVLDKGCILERDSSGRPLRVCGTHLDITSRKLAEREDLANRVRLEIIHKISTMTDADEKDICDLVVEAMVDMTGSSVGFLGFLSDDEAAMKIQAWSLSAMAECAIHDKQVEFSVDQAGLWAESVRNRKLVVLNDYNEPHPARKGCPEGHIQIFRFMTVPVFDSGRIVAVGVVGNKHDPYEDADVRQLVLLLESWWEQVRLRRMDQEKQALQSQLVQAQKMESVGRLAGGVAHDFNNMLGIILGHTDMALRYVGTDQPAYSDLRTIRKASKRSADLVRQLLAFARKQTISPRVLNLNDTVEGMLKMIRRIIGEDIQLLWHPGADLWPVNMDAAQIDQILANLCVNARDAIDGVGKVTIETGNVTLGEDYCDHHVGATPGDYVYLAVSDDGSGMDREVLDKLFEPFFTTKEVGKGTGLGLPTVYGIVKQNQGCINVYSEPGQGTTFRIYIPRHQGEVENRGRQDIEELVRGGHEIVLLVEDEPTLLKMGKTVLEKLGYTVLSAGSPRQALEIAEKHINGIHLLITDVIMPGMNGRELANKLLSLYPDLKVLYMSGYTADVIADHGVLAPGVKFVQKPFSMKELSVKVREALSEGKKPRGSE